MFDLFVFSINHSDRVKEKFAAIKQQYPHARLIVYKATIADMILKAKSVAFTQMFWLLDVEAELNFDLSWKPADWDQTYVHVWNTQNGKTIDQGLSLWPKNLTLTVDDIKSETFSFKMHDEVATIIKPFDIFVFADTSNPRINARFDNIRKIYPYAQLSTSMVNLIDQITIAQQKSKSKMFWFFDIEYAINSDLTWTPELWDYNYIHAFVDQNELVIDKSLMLWPTDRMINADEFTTNSFADIKFIETNNSTRATYDLILFSSDTNPRIQKRYETFIKTYPTAKIITTYTDAVDLVTHARTLSMTKMFWLMGIEYNVVNDFDISWVLDTWEQKWVHVWSSDNKKSVLQSLSLWPSDSEQEIEDEFTIANIKRIEHNAIEINPYDIFVCADVADEYVLNRFEDIKDRFPNATLLITDANIQTAVEAARSLTVTSMFWLFKVEYTIDSDFDIMWQPDAWEQKWVHVWTSDKTKSVMQSLSLWPSDEDPDLEDEYTINNMKVIDLEVVSLMPYDVFLYSYNGHDARIWQRYENITAEYPTAKLLFVKDIMEAVTNAQAYSTTKLFWLLDIEAELDFNLSWRPENWEQKWIYAWRSKDGKSIEQGLSLWPSNLTYTTFDALINIKFIDNVATSYKPYDVFFISYYEPNATANYKKLLKIVPDAKRIDGVVGIHNAHKKCAEQSTTEMFWTIDADTVLDKNFNLSYRPPLHDRQYLHLWYTRNPVNDLVYGYGAVKLWPSHAPLSHEGNWLDFTTSVGNIKIVDEIVATTQFNSSSYDSWRSGFREAVKLCYNIQSGDHGDSVERLLTWLNKANDVKFAAEAKFGARQGLEYFKQSNGDATVLKNINDFNWLKTQYKYVITPSSDLTVTDLFNILGISYV